MAVVTPLNNPGGPEGDTVTVAEKLLNTEYCIPACMPLRGRGLESGMGAWKRCMASRVGGVRWSGPA